MSLITTILIITSFITSHQRECDKVRDFYSSNKTIELSLSNNLGAQNAKNAMAIVAPEVCLYSSFSDKVETYTLKILYAQTGRSDFSIGYFQMKPSFAEHIEKIVSSSHYLKSKYAELLIHEKTAQANRAERIVRLSSLKYQTLYLSAFYEIALSKTSTWPSTRKSKIQCLKNIATLYNGGLDLTESAALNLQTKKQFPSIFSEKYNYSDIVVEFFIYLNN